MTLSNRQLVILVAIGVVFWFCDMLCARYLGAWVFDYGLKQIVLYVLMVPVSWITIWIIQKITSLGQDNLFRGIAIAVMTAMLIHGLALTWFPAEYGLSMEIRFAAAASIVWGYGVVMVVACWMTRAK